MLFRPTSILFKLLLCWTGIIHLSAISIDPTSIAVVTNPCPHYSLANSVDFHPKKNLFCVTYTHANRVALYKINDAGKPEIIQILSNPGAQLSEPQHAVFSPDGEKIVVANWTNQTLTVYKSEKSGRFAEKPAAVIPSLSILALYKPHGIAFSPCGSFLAVAYGAGIYYPRAIALLRITERGCELASIVKTAQIPKGITFSPDGSCLLVTFSDANCLVTFNLDRQNLRILPNPRQIIQGGGSRISRPEDVKISPDGSFCAITNSHGHTVTFYSFDPRSNWITQSTPLGVLQNPASQLCFPHGIAFSSDGAFLAITEFGSITTTPEGDIAWGKNMRPEQAKVRLYKITQ